MHTVHLLMQEMHREAEEGRRMSQELLTARQITELLGIDKSTVYRMADDGRLSGVRVGRQWRFPAEGVQHMLDTAGLGADAAAGAPVVHETLRGHAADLLLDVLAETLGVMMVLTDLDGHPLSTIANPCPSFAQRGDDPALVEACAAEWREMAEDPDFVPRFRTGRLGFQCARAFVRSGDRLLGMVLAGGVPAPDQPAEGLWALDDEDRSRVLRLLPRVAAAFSHLAGHGSEVEAKAPAPLR
jgi:excisionase family DNA binding protein